MEIMVNEDFWKGKKVLITGHTGFKGSWLSHWLVHLGANVCGYALEPETDPALFDQLQLKNLVEHKIGDIRDPKLLAEYVNEVEPDIIIHMAAQPLVRRSYKEPVYTWQTNVMGTLNLLESVRNVTKTCAVVVVTTDKVYENKEWNYAYREVDTLGGYDPYSSSKAATELAVSSWRDSFFKEKSNIRIATARAGNVIGGGDYAEDRIVPDIARALHQNKPIEVRNPKAVRPWQHVLEPLSGYLRLAECLYESDDEKFQSAFNFGPLLSNSDTVEKLVEESIKIWSGSWKDVSDPNELHESTLLNVSIDKAYSLLDWKPKWDMEISLKHTIEWYKEHYSGFDPVVLTMNQIKEYSAS
tara:strand:+ start:184 stop:1251 length:1068 start_codon:yes stop_codon:yes gene_type:complete